MKWSAPRDRVLTFHLIFPLNMKMSKGPVIAYTMTTYQRGQKKINPRTCEVRGPPLTTSASEGEEVAKCLCYYISLCSKFAYGGGGGSKIDKILPT